jgi:RNA polymerase sigma-70 factor, ECF subfamily
MGTPLADALLAGAKEARCDDRERLERALLEGLDRARAACPALTLGSDAFVAHLAARLDFGSRLPDALTALRLEDLFVACACARGDSVAMAAVERGCFGQIDAAVGRLRAPRAMADEVKQELRERLFLGTAGRPPRIGEYAGRSSLARWIHAIATRLAIDILRRRGKETSDDALVDCAVPADNPELELLKKRYGADFRAAVKDAVLELTPEARNELRFYYVEGLTLEQIAAIHHLAVATVWRRLGKAREQVLARTQAILSERLGVGAEDVMSILRLVGSRLELSRSVFEGGRAKGDS